jgi:hypothetical protein
VANVGFKMTLGMTMLAAASGCSAPIPVMGPDVTMQTYASAVAWGDGKPACSIRCPAPEPCRARILAICSNGRYTTLESESTPDIGVGRGVLTSPSIVARCGQAGTRARRCVLSADGQGCHSCELARIEEHDRVAADQSDQIVILQLGE